MHHDYADIRSLIDRPPLWWDENSVPRYAQFSPHLRANIYSTTVALVQIACQGCGQEFFVCMSESDLQYVSNESDIAAEIREGSLHYGDPPNIDCCQSGPTMNCEDLRVVEFWRRDKFEWVRDQSLEVLLADNPDYRKPKE